MSSASRLVIMVLHFTQRMHEFTTWRLALGMRFLFHHRLHLLRDIVPTRKKCAERHQRGARIRHGP